MKILFDQNLSIKLVSALADLFPECLHIKTLGMQESPDSDLWQLALKEGFIIATKDSDFAERAMQSQISPKIIWVRMGNVPTSQVEALFRWRHQQILEFVGQGETFVLALP
jgi:predicted nuclease of predicted toxin-antitoxin system